MNENPLRFISEQNLQDLRETVSANRERYISGSFSDLELNNGWRIETKSVTVNYNAIATLNINGRSAKLDAENSIVVYDALKGMTPALAMDERIWTRLSHIEGLDYSRARWLPKTNSDEAFDKGIRKHFFAKGVLGARDDNAISRLWWNMHIAKTIGGNREKAEEYLQRIVKSADIRQAFVERSWTGARLPLARAILKLIDEGSWAAKDNNFKQLMKEINRDGGGILFEALSQTSANRFVEDCQEKAHIHLTAKI